MRSWRLIAPLTLLVLAAGCAPLQERSTARAPLPSAPVNTIFVSQGETVYTIAQRYGVTVRDLIDENRLSPPYRLSPGQRLILPVPRTYMVKAGDTLYGISRQYSLDLAELVRINGIQAPYTIRVGQTLKLPSGRTGAAPRTQVAETAQAQPQTAQSARTAEAPRPSRSPTVQSQELAPLPGAQDGAPAQSQTLAPPRTTPAPQQRSRQVAPAIGLSPTRPTPAPAQQQATQQQPAQQQRQSVPQRTGQPPPATRAPEGVTVETLPPMTGQPEPAQATPAQATPAQATPAQATPAPAQAPPQRAAAPERQVAAVPAVPPAPARETVAPPRGGRFLWPITGPILSEFGPKEGGLHNDGINIAAPRGTPVAAADTGTVAYVGNELRGFGNLLLIRHSDGWVTAYAHLETTTVEQGQKVQRGQKIGTVGQTGNVRTPQLHFEIRRGSRAIDPREHLDGGRQTSERPGGERR